MQKFCINYSTIFAIKLISDYLNKLCLPSADDYSNLLVKAALGTYVETISNRADSLHYHLYERSEEELMDSFVSCVRPISRSLRLFSVEVGVDITEENFYGKSPSPWIHPWTGERGIEGRFQYLVMFVLHRNKKIPFFVCPVHLGANKAKMVKSGINVARTIFRRIKLMLFDRGFYNAQLIKMLQEERIPYLIFVPKVGEFPNMLEAVEEIATLKYTIVTNWDRSTQRVDTNIVLIREVDGYNWIFSTNIDLGYGENYVRAYRQRWRVETNFRVHDEARIKSKSVRYVVRLFYFIVSLLMMTIWIKDKFGKMPFKAFIIGWYDEIHKQKILQRTA